jgi:hypothetical protein
MGSLMLSLTAAVGKRRLKGIGQREPPGGVVHVSEMWAITCIILLYRRRWCSLSRTLVLILCDFLSLRPERAMKADSVLTLSFSQV